MEAMMRRFTGFLALVAAVLGGCERSDVQEKVESRTPMPAGLAGVYAGEFPCSNCAAIEATLWLRADARFFLRQRFIDHADSSAGKSSQGPTATYAMGRWVWDEVAAELVLHGAGPERRLGVRDAEHMELKAASPIAHVLARDRNNPAFKDRVALDGESVVTATGATFKECLTGLELPVVVDAGAYRQLRRYHRQMNAGGKVALTIVEGHLVTDAATASERLVVDQFISLKPGTGC
jgi:hypothetical protein